MKLWILICDASRARVFSASCTGGPLLEVEGFVHPKSRLKGSDIMTDRPGRVRTGLGGKSATAMPPHTDPKDVAAADFAAELVRVPPSGNYSVCPPHRKRAAASPPPLPARSPLRPRDSRPTRRGRAGTAAPGLTDAHPGPPGGARRSMAGVCRCWLSRPLANDSTVSAGVASVATIALALPHDHGWQDECSVGPGSTGLQDAPTAWKCRAMTAIDERLGAAHR